MPMFKMFLYSCIILDETKKELIYGRELLHSKVQLTGSNQNFFVFNQILMKLGEVVVSMDNTTSPSSKKI